MIGNNCDQLFTEELAEKQWTIIEQAIDKLNSKQESRLSYDFLYKTAYNFIAHRLGDFAHARLQQSFTDVFRKNLSFINENDLHLLEHFSEAW